MSTAFNATQEGVFSLIYSFPHLSGDCHLSAGSLYWTLERTVKTAEKAPTLVELSSCLVEREQKHTKIILSRHPKKDIMLCML